MQELDLSDNSSGVIDNIDSSRDCIDGHYDFHVSRGQDYTFPWKGCVDMVTQNMSSLLYSIVTSAFNSAQADCTSNPYWWHGVTPGPVKLSYFCDKYNGVTEFSFSSGYPKAFPSYIESSVNYQCSHQNDKTGLSTLGYIGVTVGGIVGLVVAAKVGIGLIRGCFRSLLCSSINHQENSYQQGENQRNLMEEQYNRNEVDRGVS